MISNQVLFRFCKVISFQLLDIQKHQRPIPEQRETTREFVNNLEWVGTGSNDSEVVKMVKDAKSALAEAEEIWSKNEGNS